MMNEQDNLLKKDVIAFCLACFLLSRLVILGVAYITFYSFDEPPAPPGYAQTQGPLDRRPLNVLFFYDSVHYLNIAREGYTLYRTAWYPLYPLMIKALGGTAASAVAVSNLSFFIGLLALYRLGGRKAVVLASVSPIAIVFSAAYSESLFFAIASWFLVFMKQERFHWAGVLAGLGALCRPPGWALTGTVALNLFNRQKFKYRIWSFALACLVALAFPLYLYIFFQDITLCTKVNNLVFSRYLKPFWWGTVRDLSRMWAGSFYPALFSVVCLNLSGWLWVATSLMLPEYFVPGLIYALIILSFPITDENYVHATFGLLRMACAWPVSYLGLAGICKSRSGYVMIAGSSLLFALLIAYLVALKDFIF